MLRSFLPSFADELEKISTAGDLATPAVAAESNIVEGPPATPFARRKGYRKLEANTTKEAAAPNFKALAKLIRKPVLKAGGAVENLQRKLTVPVTTQIPPKLWYEAHDIARKLLT